MKTFEIDGHSNLLVTEVTGKDAEGNATGRAWSISGDQVEAHRLDPEFEKALPVEIRADLDAAVADAKAGDA